MTDPTMDRASSTYFHSRPPHHWAGCCQLQSPTLEQLLTKLCRTGWVGLGFSATFSETSSRALT